MLKKTICNLISRLLDNKKMFIFILLDDKNTLEIISPRTWCTTKTFANRVVHHGYLLTSCPGLFNSNCHSQVIVRQLSNRTLTTKLST